jgi:hypothetical protein
MADRLIVQLVTVIRLKLRCSNSLSVRAMRFCSIVERPLPNNLPSFGTGPPMPRIGRLETRRAGLRSCPQTSVCPAIANASSTSMPRIGQCSRAVCGQARVARRANFSCADRIATPSCALYAYRTPCHPVRSKQPSDAPSANTGASRDAVPRGGGLRKEAWRWQSGRLDPCVNAIPRLLGYLELSRSLRFLLHDCRPTGVGDPVCASGRSPTRSCPVKRGRRHHGGMPRFVMLFRA